MADFNPAHVLKEAGGVFRFGSGVLGKSAIVLGILELAVVVVAWRAHSDIALVGGLLIGAGIFFGWLFTVLNFAGKHPDVAVLEGAEWSGYQRFQATAKGFIPPAEELPPTLPSGSTSNVPLKLISDAERSNDA